VAALPHWLGAASISALGPWVEPALAARLPFALLLALTLTLTWYSSFHLARTEAAQPVPFAFGGEASAVDYARAMADGALLALMATLGLLQLGHETTPELVQLFAASLFLWGLAAAPYRGWRPRFAVGAALPLMAASGAPAMALVVGLLGTLVCRRSSYIAVRYTAPWVLMATVAGAASAALLGTWAWRTGFEPGGPQLLQLARLFLWFLWPAWLLVVWTLWRWRHHLLRRHISVPLSIAGTALGACIVMGGSDRALLIGLPAFAVMAAFALPTLQRGASAAMDWFSVFFFSAAAVAIAVIYTAMQTGMPSKIAANVAKLAPGFHAPFSATALVISLLGLVAWLWLVRWRTGRHQQALWKSLVLPAGGVALSWLLLMSLWLPLLDYARGMRPWTERLSAHIVATDCVAAPSMPLASVAALEHYGGWRIDARSDAATRSGCPVLLLTESIGQTLPTPAGWWLLARERRPTDRTETTLVLRRAP
jgi:hypothetical protein